MDFSVSNLYRNVDIWSNIKKIFYFICWRGHFMDLLSRTYQFLSNPMFPSRYTNYLEASKGFDDVVISQWRRSVSSNTSDATLFNSPSTLVPFLQMACPLISLAHTSQH